MLVSDSSPSDKPLLSLVAFLLSGITTYSVVIISALNLESSFSKKKGVSFPRIMVFRDYNLGYGDARCYLVYHSFWAFLCTKLENVIFFFFLGLHTFWTILIP